MSHDEHDHHEHNLEMIKEAARERLPLTHWTTLEELHGDPEVLRLKGEEFHEKPETYFAQENGKNGSLLTEAAGFVELAVLNHSAQQDEDEKKSGMSRRDFLKLSGAAMVFATAGCGLRPATKIVPYVKAPEEVIPGVANYYASTMAGPEGIGVLVKTREGRPIKIEGNPDHPISQGKLSVRGQHSIFNLYDPDRLTGPVKLMPRGDARNATALGFPVADEEIGKALAAAKGQVVLLTGTVHGPARERLIREFVGAFPNARHVMYDAWNHEVTRNAQEKCYGTKVLPRYRFDRAEYCLMLNADPLGAGYSPLEANIGYGKNRKVRDGKYSKWVAFEPHVSHTGSNCDERYRVRSNDVIQVALAIANEVSHLAGSAPIPGAGQFSSTSVEEALHLKSGTVHRISSELWANRGQGIVMAAEDENLQIIANYLNSMCDNDGKTIDGVVSPSKQSQGSLADMLNLVADMRAGKVDVLIVYGTNPEFSLPQSAGLAEAMSKVKTIVSLSDRVDETAVLADYVLPSTHWLESWGDAEPQVGVLSVQQPTILPLYENRAWEDSLMSLAKAAKAASLSKFEGGWHEFLMDTWKTQIHAKGGYEAAFADFWNSVLRDGVLNLVQNQDASPRVFKQDALTSIRIPNAASKELELVIHASPILGDGMEANNAWLLETPDPVSKVVWTNHASVSPATANRLKVKQGDLVKLEANGVSAEVQIFIQPGTADNVIALQTGWGRTHAGRVSQDMGVNAFAFLGLEGKSLKATGIPCTVSKTGKWEKVPCVMGHDYIEGRPIIFEATFDEYQKNPSAGIHLHHYEGAEEDKEDSRGYHRFHTGGVSDSMGRGDNDNLPHPKEPPSIWPEYKYDGYRWGMAIDLSSCSGCSACISACQVENNIPVVGRDQIQRGREMHWIRIDRYYSGDPDNPDFVHQPMLCQHCENAPCETVCPVLATVHNEEGLNLQIYNRCVGTRYCSNNCPYKVRRFNWYESSFMAYGEHPLELALNPDVTVREKGVMEKCSFCIQRIRDVKFNAKKFGRQVRDGELLTACQQTCPTGAIMFGDFNDPESAVAEAMRNERGYRVLEELNTRSSIVYWTKLRNREETGSHAEAHA
jgi:molybdopterin-containing oxidoreductase family iron-sulfur binding subunit